MPTYGVEAARVRSRAHDVVSIHLPQFEAGALALCGRLLGRPTSLTYHCDLRAPGRAPSTGSRSGSSARRTRWRRRLADRIVAYTQDYADHIAAAAAPRGQASRSFRRRSSCRRPAAGDVAVVPAAARARRRRPADRAGGAVRRREGHRRPARRACPTCSTLSPARPGRCSPVQHEASSARRRTAAALRPRSRRWATGGGSSARSIRSHEMPAFFGAIDCLVVPSVNSTESFGLVQVRGDAVRHARRRERPAGRAAVRPDDRHGRDRPAVGDAAALADGVARVLVQPGRYLRPRAEIAALFDPARTADGYETLFRRELVRAAGGAAGSSPGRARLARSAYALARRRPGLAAKPHAQLPRGRGAARTLVALAAGRSRKDRRGPPRARAPVPARAERRSLAWITGKVEPEVQSALGGSLHPGRHSSTWARASAFTAWSPPGSSAAAGHVVAFEPDPGRPRRLRANAALNGLEQRARRAARSPRREADGFLDRPEAATAAPSTIRPPGGACRATTTLDRFLADRRPLAPDVVKIDVEGHEAAVLRGMRRR